ncbi:MAG TPA: GGDEF domain-containing protein [Coleofasciculaceae cyanobacterium]
MIQALPFLNFGIGITYLSIPLLLIRQLRRFPARSQPTLALFAAFVCSCGFGHVAEGLRASDRIMLVFHGCTLIVSACAAIALGANLNKLLNFGEAIENALENMNVGLVVLDVVRDDAGEPVDLRWAYMNPAAIKAVGRDQLGELYKSEYGGDPIYDAVYEQYMEVLRTGESFTSEEFFSPRFDAWFHYQLIKINNDQLLAEFADITNWKALAIQDPLTGLYNRRSLVEFTDYSAVLAIDLDKFKQVNDSGGHAVGDAVLKIIAKRIQATIRADDIAIRFGGDEFAVLIRVSDSEDALAIGQEVAWRIVRAIEQPINVSGRLYTVGASIGVAKTLQRADELLYKRKGDRTLDAVVV